MLSISQKGIAGLSGDLHLDIEFRNGDATVLNWKFEGARAAQISTDQGQRGVFQSRLMAVVNGMDYATSAINALVGDLRELASANPDEFYSALAPKLMGRERLHLARRRIDVYPRRPDLAVEYSVKLVDGWFPGTNIKNEQKVAFLRAACNLKGLKPVPLSQNGGP